MKSVLFLLVLSATFTLANEIEVNDYLRGGEVKGTNEVALDAAKDKFNQVCEKWKKSVKDEVGELVSDISCGARKDSESYEHYTDSEGYPSSRLIGFYCNSTGAVKIKSDKELVEYSDNIIGDSSTVAELAGKKFFEACKNWKEASKKQFGDKFIYAACEAISVATNDSKSSNLFQYKSEGKVVVYK